MAHYKAFTAATAVVLALGLAGMVHAQEDLVAKRRAAMVDAGRNSGGLGAVARGAAISPEQLPVVKETAAKLVADFDLIKDPANWPKGTAQGEASGSFAKPEIWSDAAGFKAAVDAAVAAAANVKAAADAGDVAQLKTAQAALQATCGACHSKYRGA